MKVIKITPRGYCKGVVRALQIAQNARNQYPTHKIYILGMLVHNTYVSKALQQLNIQSVEAKGKTRLELLDQIPLGSVVIFSAHGVSQSVRDKAKTLGFIAIDASCDDVVYTQQLVHKQIEDDFDVLYIGKKGHPEAEAVLAISSRVHLIENVNDIDQLPTFNNLFVSNQTTMSLFDIEALFKAIEIKYPHAIFAQEICQATTMRQKAIADINADEVELLYIVGDKASNNSNRLAQIAKEHGVKNVYLIDSVEDIEPEQLTNIQCCAVSSGASTPTYLTNQVIEYLENYPNMNRPCVNIQHIL